MKWQKILSIILVSIALIICVYLICNRVSTEKFSKTTHGSKELLKQHVDQVHKKLKSASNGQIKGKGKTKLYLIDNFLDDSECDELIKVSETKLTKSTLTRYDPGDPNFRTSMTAYFSPGTPIEDKIEAKICEMVGIPCSYAETSQIQKYQKGQEFKLHHDYFDPEADPTFFAKGQRTWTFMVYLSDVEEGGTTKFPRVNTTLNPKKGQAVAWCNVFSDGKLDSDTLHQGSPVDKGEKYIITKWFKDKKD
jgi:prolyl 4-hydroxylase